MVWENARATLAMKEKPATLVKMVTSTLLLAAQVCIKNKLRLLMCMCRL